MALSSIRKAYKFWLTLYVKIRRYFKNENKVSYNTVLAQHMIHLYYPTTQEVEARWVQGQTVLHSYTVSKEKSDENLTL